MSDTHTSNEGCGTVLLVIIALVVMFAGCSIDVKMKSINDDVKAIREQLERKGKT